MAHIEDEFKKRFSKQELSNDDFDSEGLWDAISDELGEEQAPSSKDKGDGLIDGNQLLGLIFFSACLLGIGYLIGTSHFKAEDVMVEEQKIKQTPITQNTNEHKVDDSAIGRSDSSSKKTPSQNISTTNKEKQALLPENKTKVNHQKKANHQKSDTPSFSENKTSKSWANVKNSLSAKKSNKIEPNSTSSSKSNAIAHSISNSASNALTKETSSKKNFIPQEDPEQVEHGRNTIP